MDEGLKKRLLVEVGDGGGVGVGRIGEDSDSNGNDDGDNECDRREGSSNSELQRCCYCQWPLDPHFSLIGGSLSCFVGEAHRRTQHS
ncbi:hypothetical protein ECG_08783 [Echinococcus granulosus]|nr:hypothetical protein ECG_08783 [Echinococcus granulosus]